MRASVGRMCLGSGRSGRLGRVGGAVRELDSGSMCGGLLGGCGVLEWLPPSCRLMSPEDICADEAVAPGLRKS